MSKFLDSLWLDKKTPMPALSDSSSTNSASEDESEHAGCKVHSAPTVSFAKLPNESEDDQSHDSNNSTNHNRCRRKHKEAAHKKGCRDSESESEEQSDDCSSDTLSFSLASLELNDECTQTDAAPSVSGCAQTSELCLAEHPDHVNHGKRKYTLERATQTDKKRQQKLE